MTHGAESIMGDQQEITLGEVGRRLASLETAVHALSGQMQVALGPLGEMRVRLDIQERDLNGLGEKITDMEERIEAVQRRADLQAGGIAVAAFIATLIPWPWKK